MNERLLRIPWLEIGIVLVAVVLRFALLDIKPPHFDEGINGWFADQMTETGYYNYDPTNYHGPLHFYAVWLSQEVFGRNLIALRLPAVLPSILAVWLLLRFRTFLGAPAARWASLAMAVSPAMVFYGRYSIHESWLVLFGILATWGALGLWQVGSRKYLFALIGGITGMILTKETYVIHIFSLVLAGGVLWLWQKVIPSRPPLAWSRRLWDRDDLVCSLGIAVLVIIFFYSGTFLNFPALKGLYETFFAWTKTGIETTGHEKTSYDLIGPLNYYWLALFARYEWPALAGFLVAIVLAGPFDARLRFLSIYGCGVLLAYSVIPYKTPWCIISFSWPFYLLLGAAIAGAQGRWQAPARLVGILLILGSLVLTIRLNLFHYTDEKEPYVYVQTYDEIYRLTDPLLGMAKKNPKAYEELHGQIKLDSYYPIPWMLGDFKRIGYYSDSNPPPDFNGDMIVVPLREAGEVETKLLEPYYKRAFRLRDSQEECVAFFRKSYFDTWFQGEPPIVP